MSALNRNIKKQRVTAEDVRTCFTAQVSKLSDGVYVKSEWKDGGIIDHGPVGYMRPLFEELPNAPVMVLSVGNTVLIQVDQEGKWWIIGVQHV